MWYLKICIGLGKKCGLSQWRPVSQERSHSVRAKFSFLGLCISSGVSEVNQGDKGKKSIAEGDQSNGTLLVLSLKNDLHQLGSSWVS